MNEEQSRLNDKAWKKWGTYVSCRQWGTVREDYSATGEAWTYSTHDMARSKAYRWGEEAIAGVCDEQQLLCLAPVFWNEKDTLLKEIFYGLSNKEGNHGEDVKEIYYYLDGSPTHSYMKMLYKYPQKPYPYADLLNENIRRTRKDPEYEIMDTGIFDQDEYFDIFVEYAKVDQEDILLRITAYNRGPALAPLRILPTCWFRNTWSWGIDPYKPHMRVDSAQSLQIEHKGLGNFKLYAQSPDGWLFCENETNARRLYRFDDHNPYCKDGINDHVVMGLPTVNPALSGTKACATYSFEIEPGNSVTVKVRLSKKDLGTPFTDFDQWFETRKSETDAFYANIQKDIHDDDRKLIHRQALAGMVWNKQFYYYDVQHWLEGDPAQPTPPPARKKGRNAEWKHLKAFNIISMPDNWEYPWFAAWDLAFHAVTFSTLDPAFAKRQMVMLTREWFIHPSGKLPAYEWNFNDTNPPVHAWATWRIYQLEAKQNDGKGDRFFLETVFHKLLINFTWWVNRKDAEGNNIFEGGFLGLDNIGVFDRDAGLPSGELVEQADGTAWMAMYCLNMLRIALELSKTNKTYVEMANKFFDHFLYIAAALDSLGDQNIGLWDEQDQFFYDQIRAQDGTTRRLKIRSLVGMIPLLAVEILDDKILKDQPEFQNRMNWFLENRPDLAALVSRFNDKGDNEKRLLGLVRAHRMKAVLQYLLDETEFLSPHGIRSLSKYHLNHPYQFPVDGQILEVKYLPAESDSSLFGGNSNWRGPVWMPMNGLLIEALQRYYYYYGDSFTLEYPTGSGNFLNLNQIADALCNRLLSIFLKDDKGHRVVFGDNVKMQTDPHFKDYILFHEYFNGDTGEGLGASHQTGWTGLIARVISNRFKTGKDDLKP
jgi:hypothetical protein